MIEKPKTSPQSTFLSEVAKLAAQIEQDMLGEQQKKRKWYQKKNKQNARQNAVMKFGHCILAKLSPPQSLRKPLSQREMLIGAAALIFCSLTLALPHVDRAQLTSLWKDNPHKSSAVSKLANRQKPMRTGKNAAYSLLDAAQDLKSRGKVIRTKANITNRTRLNKRTSKPMPLAYSTVSAPQSLPSLEAATVESLFLVKLEQSQAPVTWPRMEEPSPVLFSPLHKIELEHTEHSIPWCSMYDVGLVKPASNWSY